MIKEYPALMSTPMVKAFLDGSKSMTRRPITPYNSVVGVGKVDWAKFDFNAKTFAKHDLMNIMADGAAEGSLADISAKDGGRAPLPWVDNSVPNWQYLHTPYNWSEEGTIFRIFPKWNLGDRLWVRETCYKDSFGDWRYKASDALLPMTTNYYKRNVLPSIHMPRWAARIIRDIIEIRAERIQNITEGDAIKEGLAVISYAHSPRMRFSLLWDTLYAKRGYSWDSNPWVWAYRLKKIEAGK